MLGSIPARGTKRKKYKGGITMLYEREFELGCKLSPYDVRDHKVAAVGVLPDSFELDFSNI